jgi:ACS family tartrate transporter-like MFS transporter
MVGDQNRTVNTPLSAATMRRVAWRLLPLLFPLYVVSFVDRTNVSLAALQMNRDLGFSAAVYGFGAGVFFLGYALLEVPSNLVLARVGARRWIGRIAISWGLLASAMMLVRSAEAFYAVRFLLGAAEAGFFPGVVYYLGQWFPERQRARAISAFMLGVPLSVAIGGPLGGSLLSLDGRSGLAGWQWLFILEGVPAVLLGVAALRWLTDRPEDAGWLSAAEREWLRARLDEERRLSGGWREESLRRAIGSPTFWRLSVPYVVVGLTSYALIYWAPMLVREILELDELGVGLVIGGIGLTGGVGMIVNGIHSDQSGERVRHAAVPLLIAALGFAAATARSLPMVAMAGLALAITGLYAFLPVFWCLPARVLGGTAAAGGIALLNSVGSLGGFVGPTVLGLVKQGTGSFAGGLLAAGVLTLGGGIATLVLLRVPVLASGATGSGAAGSAANSRREPRLAVNGRVLP